MTPIKSKYRGVHWSKSNDRWKAEIFIRGKRIHLYTSKDETRCADAWDAAKIKLRRFATWDAKKSATQLKLNLARAADTGVSRQQYLFFLIALGNGSVEPTSDWPWSHDPLVREQAERLGCRLDDAVYMLELAAKIAPGQPSEFTSSIGSRVKRLEEQIKQLSEEVQTIVEKVQTIIGKERS